jgi:hypothetical protein
MSAECPLRVNFYRFDGHRTMSGIPPKADLFRQNVWIAPNIGLFSPAMKTGILCQLLTFHRALNGVDFVHILH